MHAPLRKTEHHCKEASSLKRYMSMPQGPCGEHHLILPGTRGTSVHVYIGEMGWKGRGKVPYWEMAPRKVSCQPGRREAAEQVEQQSTQSHLCQPFTFHLGHTPSLSLSSIRFISKQKDHSSVLNTFLQKETD